MASTTAVLAWYDGEQWETRGYEKDRLPLLGSAGSGVPAPHPLRGRARAGQSVATLNVVRKHVACVHADQAEPE